MTNNTIPNVPRYRVEKTGRVFWPYCVRAGNGTREVFVGHKKQCAVVAAELETAFEDGKFVSGIGQSPAGVDGLEVVAYLIGGEPSLKQCAVRGVVNEPLCRLSAAQAIIDGLRGEVERLSLPYSKMCEQLWAAQQQRDQLAELLRDVRKGVHWQIMANRIDTALSAGKEGE